MSSDHRPDQRPDHRRKVALALATVYVLWGSTYLAIRFVVHEIPPLLGAGIRFLVAGSVLYALARARGAAPPTARQARNAGAVGLLLLVVGNGIVNVTEKRVDSGLTALVVATMPLWMTLIDAIRPGGARPRARAVVGLLVGFAGTALLTLGRGRVGAGSIDLAAVALLNVAALSWAAGSLLARHADLPADGLVTSGVEMLIGGALLATLGIAGGGIGELVAHPPSSGAIVALGYLVVFGSWFGYSAFSWLMRNAQPALVGTYAYVNPIVAVALGWALAGEPIDGSTAAAAALVVVSVALVTTSRR